MATIDDLIFTLNEDGTAYTVKAASTSVSGELVIPAEYEGLPVTKIGHSAFYRNMGLTSITIPASVTSVRDLAFYACAALRSVVFEGDAPEYGYYMFSYALSSVTAYYGTSGWGQTWGGVPVLFVARPGTEEPEPEPEPGVTITSEPAGLRFSAGGGEKSAELSAGEDPGALTVSASASWLTASAEAFSSNRALKVWDGFAAGDFANIGSSKVSPAADGSIRLTGVSSSDTRVAFDVSAFDVDFAQHAYRWTLEVSAWVNGNGPLICWGVAAADNASGVSVQRYGFGYNESAKRWAATRNGSSMAVLGAKASSTVSPSSKLAGTLVIELGTRGGSGTIRVVFTRASDGAEFVLMPGVAMAFIEEMPVRGAVLGGWISSASNPSAATVSSMKLERIPDEDGGAAETLLYSRLTVSAAENADAGARTGTVTVRGENGGSVTVPVVQTGKSGESGDAGNVSASPRAMVFPAGTRAGGEISENPLADKALAPIEDFAEAADGSALTASSAEAWIETSGAAFGVAPLDENAAERAGTVIASDADGGAALVEVEQKRLREFSMTAALSPLSAPKQPEWAEHFEFNPDEVKVDWAAGRHPLRLLIHDGETEAEQREIYGALEFSIEYENGDRANRSGWLSVSTAERRATTARLTFAANAGAAAREGEIVFAATENRAETRLAVRQSGKTELAPGAATPGGEALVPYLASESEIVCPAAGGEVEIPLPFPSGAAGETFDPPSCPEWASAATAGDGSAFERSCVYIDVSENKIDDYDESEQPRDLISRSAVITARLALEDGTTVERSVRVTQRTLSMDVRATALYGQIIMMGTAADRVWTRGTYWEKAEQTDVVTRLANGRVTVPATPERQEEDLYFSDASLRSRQVLRICDGTELTKKRLIFYGAAAWRQCLERFGRGEVDNPVMTVCDAPEGTKATQLYFTAVCAGGDNDRWALIDEGRSGYLYVFNFSKRSENLILRSTAIGHYGSSTDEYLHADTAVSAPADSPFPTVIKLTRQFPDVETESFTLQVAGAPQPDGSDACAGALLCTNGLSDANIVVVIPSENDAAIAECEATNDTNCQITSVFVIPNREKREPFASGGQDELCAGALPAAASELQAPRLDFEENPARSVFRGRNAWSASRIDAPLPDWVLSESGYAPAASGQIGGVGALEFLGEANATCNYSWRERGFVFSGKITVDPDSGVFDVASVRVRQAAVETVEGASVKATPESASFGKDGGTAAVSVEANAAAGAVHGYVEDNSLHPVQWLTAGSGAVSAAPNDYAARSARAVYRGWFGGEAAVAVSQAAFEGTTTLGLEFVPRRAVFAARGGKFRVWALRRGNSIATLMQRIRVYSPGADWLTATVRQIPGQDDAETGVIFETTASCIELEVAENAGAEARETNLIAGFAGGVLGNVEIAQDGAETESGGGDGELSAEPAQLEFAADETAAKTVSIAKDDAEADCGALSAATDADWLEISLSADEATLSVRPTGAAAQRRTAFVAVFGEKSGFAQVFVAQQGAEKEPDPEPVPEVRAGEATAAFGSNGGALTVSVEANAAAGAVRAETSAGWLTAEMLAGGASVSIRAAANAGTESRTGTVWLRGENGGEASIAVAQEGKAGELPSVSVSPAELVFGALGGELAAGVSANEAAGAVSARADAEWISAELSADGTALTVSVPANAKGESARAGTVRLFGADGGAATLSVRQYALADGDGLRLIPWSVSDGAAYALLISAEAGGEQTLKIFDAGTRAEVASFPCDYPAESLSAIRWKSSNDVIWLTHPERPVAQVTRSDAWDAEGAHSFAFAFGRYPFSVEPMLDWNVGAAPLTLTAQRYQRTVYAAGEIVYNGDAYDLSASAFSYTVERTGEGIYNVVAGCRFAEPSDLDSIEDGAAIQLCGVSFKIFWRAYYTDGNGVFASASDLNTVSYKDPRGVLRKLTGVVGSDGGYFEAVVDQLRISADSNYGTAHVQVGAALAGTANLPAVEKDFEIGEEFYAEVNALAPGFYESLKDNNSAPLTDASAWRRTFCVGKELRLYGAGVEEWRVGQHFALTAKAYSATSGNWGVDAEGEVSEPLLAFGSVKLKTEGGVWSGRLVLEQSLDDGETWEFLDAVVSENGSSNPSVTVDVDELGALVRVRCDRRETATTRQALIPSDGGAVSYKEVENDTGCKWSLTCEGYSDVYVKAKAPQWFQGDKSEAHLLVECISGVPYPVSTTTWAEGAWCSRYGYPRTVTLHEERLCFAGNVKRPATLWCSAINHYDDFRRGTLDTSALSVKPTAHSYGRAAWLASGRQLLLGTTLEEFAVGSRDAVAAMSGSNIVAKSSASFGSADSDCVTTREGIFSVLPGRRKINALKYDMVEEYTGTEVSQRAETLLESGVKELAHVRAPQEVLFALCEDGTIAALTYDFSQNVAGWSKLTVLDGAATMCAVRRGERDVLVLAVAARGEVLLGEIDFGGDVWTDDGDAYESVCEPMPMPVYSDDPHGASGKIAQADVYLTAGTVFEYSFDADGGRTHRFVSKGRDGNARALFGRIELGQNGDWTDEASVVFSTDYAGPFVIAAVGAEIRFGG